MHMGVRVRDVGDTLNELRAHFDGRETELLVGLFLDCNFEACGTFAIEGSRSKVSAPIAGLVAERRDLSRPRAQPSVRGSGAKPR